MRATSVKPAGSWPGDAADSVVLATDDRHRRRMAMTGTRGLSFVLDLPDTRLPRKTDGTKHWGDGFEIETMINIRAAVDGMKVGEVGSIEHRRIHGETNLNTFRDGFRVLRTIFSEYGRMRSQKRNGQRRPGGVIVHQQPGRRTHGVSSTPAPAPAERERDEVGAVSTDVNRLS